MKNKRARIVFSLVLVHLLGCSFFAHADTDLRGELSAVRDQGENRNLCSAFEATTLAEFLIWEKYGDHVSLSENYNYWAAKTYELSSSYLQSAYANIDGMPAYLAVEALSKGMLAESDWPYDSQNGVSRHAVGYDFSTVTGPTNCFTGVPPASGKIIPLKIQTTYIPREKIVDYIETKKRPVLMNINWYFGGVDTAGNVRLPTASESKACAENKTGCGGHVIMLVGYQSRLDRFIFRNSWGPNWGERGYGTIPVEFIQSECEMCHFKASATQLSQDEKDLITRSSQGVTAEWSSSLLRIDSTVQNIGDHVGGQQSDCWDYSQFRRDPLRGIQRPKTGLECLGRDRQRMTCKVGCHATNFAQYACDCVKDFVPYSSGEISQPCDDYETGYHELNESPRLSPEAGGACCSWYTDGNPDPNCFRGC